MTDAKRDDNQVTTLGGVLNTDGSTPTPVKANASKNAILADDGAGGSDSGGIYAIKDDNMVPIAIAASESDGSTPVALYVNSSGQLLIDSN